MYIYLHHNITIFSCKKNNGNVRTTFTNDQYSYRRNHRSYKFFYKSKRRDFHM